MSIFINLQSKLKSCTTKYIFYDKFLLKKNLYIKNNRKYSSIIQCIHQHYSLNFQNHINDNCKYTWTRPCLLASNYNILENQKRNISMVWLDKLAISQSKWFQSASHSAVVENSMNVLQYFHDSTHLSWWLSIVLSTVILRTSITFPLAIYQNYIFAKIENLHKEMNELVKELKKETAVAIKHLKWDEKHARVMYNRSARRMWKELIIRENCHPFKASVLLWAQIPLWVVLSMSYRNMASLMPFNDINAQVIFMELSAGGFGWLPNLIEVDHSLILPIAMAICNILIVDINSSTRPYPEMKRQKYIGYFFKSLSLVLIPIAASVPGCLVLYWTTSSFCGLAQNLLLLSPRVKRACGIPKAPSENANPYQHLYNFLGDKYLFRSKKAK